MAALTRPTRLVLSPLALWLRNALDSPSRPTRIPTIVGVRDGSIEGFAKVIVDTPPQAWRPTGDPETWPTQWATESLLLARSALTQVEIGAGSVEASGKCSWPITLQRDYTNWSNRQTLAQLGKAGFRLAETLRVVFTPQGADEDAPTGSISNRPRR